MRSILLMFCLSLLSFTAFSQNEHAMHGKEHGMKMDQPENAVHFKDANATAVYQHYLALKDALVSSDQETTKSAAEMLEKSLQAAKSAKKLTGQAKAVAEASTLAQQRQAFSDLSNAVIQWVKSQKMEDGQIFLEYCPMANDNTGGYWLANESEINNPYFGKMMLHCGKVAETIH
ncbi:hypothetical protein CRP01_35130 [Flavilitoribacter nigricans DSM 23189 = NBRC 102662]|uniref:DUF3347 domain-containing protein n=2 Tax=Flavilitoribacter TaxID=2762562 RepID=A0A2D0N004_FLAN2|nr:hypothetical protein CRP01_35130 [Flavilitoribacter nigricans DSM 23189 = NBRC 102662]